MKERIKRFSKRGTKHYSEEKKAGIFDMGKIFGQSIPALKERFNKSRNVFLGTINSPSGAAHFLRKVNSGIDQESFIILHLNSENKILSYYTIGSLSANDDVPIILTTAFIAGSSSLIIAHNHPDGSLTPSDEDISLVSKIKLSASLLDISIQDYLIITKAGYFSFAACGSL